MLNHAPFGFDLLRKYTGAFGSLFKDIYVVRKDSSGNVTQTIKVPIMNGPKEKAIARTESDPNIDRPASATFPIMSFEMKPMVAAGDRQISPINKKYVYSDGTYSRQFQPVAYDIPFVLNVMANKLADAYAIVEQIVPFFTPEFPTKMELVPEMSQQWNVPVVLQSVALQDSWDGDFKNRRYIEFNLEFLMKAWFFGPINEAPVIKFANANIYVPFTNTAAEGVGITTALDRVTVQPGLTANGEPTSNASLSVPYQDIQVGDDWGVIVTIAGDLDPAEGTGGADEPVT